jgi:hypothetical protein
MRANRFGFFSLGSISTARKKLADQAPRCIAGGQGGFASALDAVLRWSVIPGARKFFRIFFSIIQHNRKESIHPA